MTHSLLNHHLGYHLSNKDIPLCVLSALTLTAIPFAKRHCEMAQRQSQNYLGHTVLCIAECIPVIGIIVALIEYAVASLFHHMRHNLSNKPLSIRHIAPLSPSQELSDPCGRIISPAFEHKNTTFPSPGPILAPTFLSQTPAKIYTDPCELLRDTENFFSTYAFPDPLTFPEINPEGLTSEDLLTQLLGKYQGICIGEAHAHSSPKYFLTVNMPLFKKLGVDTLYLEGYHTLHDELDAYFNGVSIDLPATLTAAINEFSPQTPGFYTEHDVIKAAKQAGIRMVNIDSQGAYDVPVEGVKRVAVMNYQAKLIIDQDKAAHPGGKSIIYAGTAHTSRIAGVPSLGQIHQFPAIIMRDRLFPSFFLATDDTVPFYTIEKETVEKSIADPRKMNHDFVIRMDQPFK